MPRIDFNQLISYLENLADNHIEVKTHYRWNISEFTGALRKGVELPVVLIDAPETKTTGDKTKTIHNNITAITVLGKPNTRTGNSDDYAAQNDVLNYCQNICFDFETRILYDADQVRDANNNKNWLYGLVDKKQLSSF